MRKGVDSPEGVKSFPRMKHEGVDSPDGEKSFPRMMHKGAITFLKARKRFLAFKNVFK